MQYRVSYYLEDKKLHAAYYGDNIDTENLFSLYWEGLDVAGQKIERALYQQEKVPDFHDMPEEYIATAAAAILHVMDEYSMMAEKTDCRPTVVSKVDADRAASFLLPGEKLREELRP